MRCSTSWQITSALFCLFASRCSQAAFRSLQHLSVFEQRPSRLPFGKRHEFEHSISQVTNLPSSLPAYFSFLDLCFQPCLQYVPFPTTCYKRKRLSWRKERAAISVIQAPIQITSSNIRAEPSSFSVRLTYHQFSRLDHLISLMLTSTSYDSIPSSALVRSPILVASYRCRNSTENGSNFWPKAHSPQAPRARSACPPPTRCSS